MKVSQKESLKIVCNAPLIKFHCSEVGHATTCKLLYTLPES